MKKIILICIIFFVSINISCNKKGPLVMNIVSYLGIVTVNGEKVTRPGKQVLYGDTISTAKGATCDLVINKKNIFRLQEKTVLVVNLSKEEALFDLKEGAVGSTTRRIFTKLSKYRFRTPTVVASVRGTSFFVKVVKADSTYFCVCNGEVDLQAGSRWNETVRASHHASRLIYKDKNGTLKVKTDAGLRYHDDAFMEDLARSIHEKIDWTVPDQK